MMQSSIYKSSNSLFLKRFFAENSLAFFLQFSGLGLSTLVSAFSPLWLATGTSSALILLRGSYVLPGIILGSFCAFYFAHITFGLSFFSATILGIQSVLFIVIAFKTSLNLLFSDKKVFLKFNLYCLALTGLISILFYFLFHLTFTSLLIIWLANFNGMVIVAIAMLTWDNYFCDITKLKNENLISMFVNYSFLMLCACLLVFSRSEFFFYILEISSLSLILIISLHYKWCGSVAAVFFSALIQCLAAYLKTPLFSASSSVDAFNITSFLALTAIVGLSTAVYKEIS